MNETYLKVGVISSTHGVRGEVKVYPTTDDMTRFKKLKSVFLLYDNEYVTLDIAGVKFFKNMVILKFRGIDSINDVEKYIRSELYVDREHAVKLEKNEFFITDLIGMRLVSDDNAYEGVLMDVLTGSANDIYEVKLSDNRTLLLPAIKECIINVDLENRLITFHMMNGLLD